ncbi:prepilin peptidase [bacterium]|nr:prepilin peptidase [candidate division CSSED10-310 bacterium]
MLFVLGLAIGSFLNVVICRVPENRSIIRPSSHCPSCRHQLKAWENIPLLSYAVLRGKCHGCGTRISLQYPLVELATGLMFAAVACRYGFTFSTMVYSVFTAFLIALSVIDYHTKLLPDAITLPGVLFAVFISILSLHPFLRPHWDVHPWRAFLGVVAGAGPLLLIAWVYLRITGREGMGMGDIKLMIFAGALLGPGKAVLSLFLGALTGTLVGIPVSLVKGGTRHTEIPFGPFLSLGAWISAMWGGDLVAWYLRFSHLT